MHFKPSYDNPIQLRGSNRELRWEIRRSDEKLLKKGCEHGIQRFALTVGRDLKVTDAAGEPRRVVMKTLKYPLAGNAADYEAKGRETRRNLDAQIDLLNRIGTPLLAQPLDYLTVPNRTDGLPEALKQDEPVLVLAWQPGSPLPIAIRNGIFTLRPKPGAPTSTPSSRESLPADTKAIANFGRSIVTYLQLLAEHRVVCFDLNPLHILVAGNRVPRFLGVGSLCPLRSDNSVDDAHPNYLATSFGYMPPELSNPALGHGRQATTATLGAFALGAILAQMVTGEERLPRAWVPRGSLVYPQPTIEVAIQERCGRSAKAFHHLIALLCAPDPKKRGTNLESIDDFLAVIAEDADASPEMARIVQPLLRGADFQVEGTLVAIAADGSGGFAFCEDPQVGEVYLNDWMVQHLPEPARRANQSVTLYLEKTPHGLRCQQVQALETSTAQGVVNKWHSWLIQQGEFSEGVVTYEDSANGFCNVFVDKPNQMLVHLPQRCVDQFSKRPVVGRLVLVRPETGERCIYSERFIDGYVTTVKRENELRRSAEVFDAAQLAQRRKRKLETLPWIKGTVKWFDTDRGFGYITPTEAKMGEIRVCDDAINPEVRAALFKGLGVRVKASPKRDGQLIARAVELL